MLGEKVVGFVKHGAHTTSLGSASEGADVGMSPWDVATVIILLTHA